ncbi:MAG TPA: hypothetical protein VJC05_02000 [Candidatus Andersenbacteria bacterium]|nr:hypothetical protein [Candidatus Andersenbacteria bacterium]
MHNWSVNEEELKKHPDEYQRWRLEQLINFGLGQEKISARDLRSQLPQLRIDPARRRYLNLLLDDSATSH